MFKQPLVTRARDASALDSSAREGALRGAEAASSARSGTTEVARSGDVAATAQVSDGVALPSDVSATELAIREANLELEARVANHFAVPLAVLVEQRDRALAKLAEALDAAAEERALLVEEHDRFVAYLMEEQDKKVDALEKQLRQSRESLQRQAALGAGSGASTAAPSSEQLADLRRLLEISYSELDGAKAVATKLEEERDEALRTADDIRLEVYGQLEAARDEANNLQAQVDDVARQLEEARDQARDDALEAANQVDELQRELDERRAEVTRLRERLDNVTQEVLHSRPPPPAAPEELTVARAEVQALRKELIDTKRQLSKVSHEYEALRTARMRPIQPTLGRGAMLAVPVAVPGAVSQPMANGSFHGLPVVSVSPPEVTGDVAPPLVPEYRRPMPALSPQAFGAEETTEVMDNAFGAGPPPSGPAMPPPLPSDAWGPPKDS